MKRVLITGPTGAIGTALIRRLIREKIEVTAVCRTESARADAIPDSPYVERIFCDLAELQKLPSLVKKPEYDIFYHFAWDGTFGGSRNNLQGQLKNAEYTLDAVEIAKELGCRRFVGAGSQAEYGRTEQKLEPDTPAFPENGYGTAKLCAGQMSRLRCEQLGMEHIWVRILSVYGPGDGKNTLIMYAIRQLLRGEAVELTEGRQIWDYLYAEDAAEALYLLGEKGVSGKTYPVGSGEAVPLRHYLEILRDQIRPDAEMKWGAVPYGTQQVMHLSADLTELTKDTGFVPKYSFSEGIAETIQWCRQQENFK